MGHQTQALATYREAEDFLAAADRKELLTPPSQVIRREAIRELGYLYLETQQLEDAKRFFLRVLFWPGLPIQTRLNALPGMARYHKERNEWINMMQCLEEVRTLLPQVQIMDSIEVRTYLYFADAFEGQGDMMQAIEYGEKARNIYLRDCDDPPYNAEIEACSRRKASMLLLEERPAEAVQILEGAVDCYISFIQASGINVIQLHLLTPSMAALKVLVAAYAQTENEENVAFG